MYALAFSPDGNTLPTGSGDGAARLWDVATHQKIGVPLTAEGSGFVTAVAFSRTARLSPPHQRTAQPGCGTSLPTSRSADR